MKTTLKLFIKENENYGLSKLSLEACAEIIGDYAKSAMNSNVVLYRGSSHYGGMPFMLSKPSTFERKSTTSLNIANTLTSNLAEWQGYPKRNRSLMMTNITHVAGQYSDILYRVFPFDGANIGLCNGEDFWSSFKKGFSDTYLSEIVDIEDAINSIIINASKILRQANFEGIKSTDNFSTLCKYFAMVDSVIASHGAKAFERTLDPTNISLKHNWEVESSNVMIEEIAKHGMFNYLSDCFSPQANDFSKITVSELHTISGRGQEMWTDANCVAVRLDMVNDVMRELKNQGYIKNV